MIFKRKHKNQTFLSENVLSSDRRINTLNWNSGKVDIPTYSLKLKKKIMLKTFHRVTTKGYTVFFLNDKKKFPA